MLRVQNDAHAREAHIAVCLVSSTHATRMALLHPAAQNPA